MGDRLGIHGVVHILAWCVHFWRPAQPQLSPDIRAGESLFKLANFIQRQRSGKMHDLANGHTRSLSKRPGFNAWNYTLRGVYQFLDLTLRSWCLSEGSKKNRSRCLIRTKVLLICLLENGPIVSMNFCQVWTRCKVCTITLARPCIIVYDHTMLKAPVLVWSLQLSNIGPC